jgi:hypothetical protein
LANAQVGHRKPVPYAVGFARPDRWKQAAGVDAACPWHAVEAHRPPDELDGEIELAVCGAIVQVWGSQDWARLSAGRTACPECRRATAEQPAAPPEVPATRPAAPRHLRVVS